METEVGGQVHYQIPVTRKRVMGRHTLFTLQNGRIISIPKIRGRHLPVKRERGMKYVVDGEWVKDLPKVGDIVDMYSFGDDILYPTFTAYLFEFKGVRIASMVERTAEYHFTRPEMVRSRRRRPH